MSFFKFQFNKTNDEDIEDCRVNVTNGKKLTLKEHEKFLDIFNKVKTDYSPETYHTKDVERLVSDQIWATLFVRNRKQNIKNGALSAAKTLKWRAEHNVSELREDTISRDEINAGSIYVRGKAVDGTRVFYMHVKLFDKKRTDSFKELFLLWLETLRTNEPENKITIVMSAGGAGLKNIDLRAIKFIMDSLDNHYPDILKKMIILDLPWILNSIWNIVKQWLTDDQKCKVNFITAKNLPTFIHKKHLLKSLGGEDIWKYDFEEEYRSYQGPPPGQVGAEQDPSVYNSVGRSTSRGDPSVYNSVGRGSERPDTSNPSVYNSNDPSRGGTSAHSLSHGGTSVHNSNKDGTSEHNSTHGGTSEHNSAHGGTSVHNSTHGGTSVHDSTNGGTSVHNSTHGGTSVHDSTNGGTSVHNSTNGGTSVHNSNPDGTSVHNSNPDGTSVNDSNKFNNNSSTSVHNSTKGGTSVHSSAHGGGTSVQNSSPCGETAPPDNLSNNGTSVHNSTKGSRCNTPPSVHTSQEPSSCDPNATDPSMGGDPSSCTDPEIYRGDPSHDGSVVHQLSKKSSRNSTNKSRACSSTNQGDVDNPNQSMGVGSSSQNSEDMQDVDGTTENCTEKNEDRCGDDTNEANCGKLGDLLWICPAVEICFDETRKEESSCRFITEMKLRNLTNEGDKQIVTFKIKTNAPKHYYVKPSIGSIKPGETLSVKLTMAPGHETCVEKDRFLLLYHIIDCCDKDLAIFWKEHECAATRFEHRLKVQFNGCKQEGADTNFTPTTPDTNKSRKLSCEVRELRKRVCVYIIVLLLAVIFFAVMYNCGMFSSIAKVSKGFSCRPKRPCPVIITPVHAVAKCTRT